jgi:hypothetical protein
MPLKKRVSHFALGRLRPILDLGEQRRLDPDAAVRDLFVIGLRLPDQRLQPRLQILGRCGVEVVGDLSIVDQVGGAAAAADVEAIPLVVTKRRTAIWRASARG